MDFIKFLVAAMSRYFLGIILILTLIVPPVHSLDSLDAQIFINGFNAYQKADYNTAIDKMKQVLKQFPDTPLRDMAIFWLARANYRAGNQKEAAKHMAQFFKEYPDSPLKGTVEKELVENAARYERGESFPETVNTQLAVEKAAAIKAEADRLNREKTEAKLLAAKKVAEEKAATEKLAVEKAAAIKAEADRLNREKTEAKLLAAKKVAEEKAATEKLAVEKAAAIKAEADRLNREKTEANRLQAKQTKLAKMDRAETLRGKAITEYMTVIDRFPGSGAAVRAGDKLKALGITYPAAVEKKMAAVVRATGENAQTISFQVGQFAAVEFNVIQGGQIYEVGRRVSIPFEIVNHGNGNDSFLLATDFSSEYRQQFVVTAEPETPINSTPILAPGEQFKGLIKLTIPTQQIDGQKSNFPIKISSRFAGEVSQSRQVNLAASAPLLRAVIKSDKGQVLPGERASYRIALLNIGTSAAHGLTFRLNYPPQYEPIDYVAAGFSQETKSSLLLDGLQLNSGESKDFTVTFRLKEEAIARQELFVRTDLINHELQTKDSFLSTAVFVQGVSGLNIRTASDNLVVIPGQTLTIPLIVTNTGNQTETVGMQASLPALLDATFYLDLNRDGVRQTNEPVISKVGSLAPKEEAYLLMAIATSVSAADGSDANLNIVMEPESDRRKVANLSIHLLFSRPVLKMVVAGKGSMVKPGEVSTFELNCVNRGSSMARIVELQSILPSYMEVVGVDPPVSQIKDNSYLWRFAELGTGEMRSVKVSFRVKGGLAVGTNVQVKTIISYEDQLGNRY